MRTIFQEQVEWAVQEKADFILGETFSNSQEAKAALEAIKKYGNGRFCDDKSCFVFLFFMKRSNREGWHINHQSKNDFAPRILIFVNYAYSKYKQALRI